VTERGYPEVHRLCARNDLLGAEAARYAVEDLGVHRVAVLRGRDDLADAFVQTTEQLGATVVLDTYADLTFDVSRLTSAELIFLSGGAIEGAELIAQARQAGIEADFMGVSELDSPYLAYIGGEAVRGTFYVTAVPRVRSGDFVASYQALAGRSPGPQAIAAYDATRVLLEAVARAVRLHGKPSRDLVVAELRTMQNYPGLIGSITFDDRGDLVDPKMYIYRFEL